MATLLLGSLLVTLLGCATTRTLEGAGHGGSEFWTEPTLPIF